MKNLKPEDVWKKDETNKFTATAEVFFGVVANEIDSWPSGNRLSISGEIEKVGDEYHLKSSLIIQDSINTYNLRKVNYEQSDI